MIRKLNPQDPLQARAILDVQLPAYRIEADLIGFDGIPMLQDTVEKLAACQETFYGYYAKGNGAAEELAGMIAFERKGDTLDITRVVVHPDHFRKGIARQMVQFVQALETNADAARVAVHTGARNTPAIRLYEQDGFTRIDEIEVAPGICLAVLEKQR